MMKPLLKWGLIGGGALLLVGGVITTIVVIKKRKAAEKAKQEEAEALASSQASVQQASVPTPTAQPSTTTQTTAPSTTTQVAPPDSSGWSYVGTTGQMATVEEGYDYAVGVPGQYVIHSNAQLSVYGPKPRSGFISANAWGASVADPVHLWRKKVVAVTSTNTASQVYNPSSPRPTAGSNGGVTPIS